MVVGFFGHHHAIDQHAGDLHLTRVERAAVGHPLHLRDDDAAAIVGGHRNGQRLQRQRLFFHGHVAVEVGRGATDDAHMNREGLVEQVVLAVDGHQVHQLFPGDRVDLAAAKTRVNKRTQTNAGQRAGLAGSDVTKQVRDHALRQVVGLNLVARGQCLKLRHQPPVPAHHALDQPAMAEMVEPALLAIALTRGVDQRKVARIAHAIVALLGLGEETFLKRHGDAFGKTDADKAASSHGVATAHQLHRLGGAHHLATPTPAQLFNHSCGIAPILHALAPSHRGRRTGRSDMAQQYCATRGKGYRVNPACRRCGCSPAICRNATGRATAHRQNRHRPRGSAVDTRRG